MLSTIKHGHYFISFVRDSSTNDSFMLIFDIEHIQNYEKKSCNVIFHGISFASIS